MVKDQVKECWHENVTQCHDTYVTEFLPSQEQKCEETFWKSCKIDFKEAPYNYTMKQCHSPLVKECDKHPTYSPNKDADIVCKTWFESECNTTFVNTSPNKDDLPNTWCKKVPRKICAPDNCRMVPGPEQCNQKMMVSTIQKPSEVCDLQPQTHCRLITRLVPHLIQKEVCRRVPKEMCHLALANPHLVKKPMRLRWCTKTPPPKAKKPSYKPPTPSYLPPSKRASVITTSSPGNINGLAFGQAGLASNSPPPSYTTLRPGIQFQRRSHQDAYETKFKPILLKKAEQVEEKSPQHILIEDFFVQNSAEDLELITKTHHDHDVHHHAEPLVSRNSYQNNKDLKPADHDLQKDVHMDNDQENSSHKKAGNSNEDDKDDLSDVVESILSKLRSTTEIMAQPFDENYNSEDYYYNRHDQDDQQDYLHEQQQPESIKTELLQDEYGAGELKASEPEPEPRANISEMPNLPASISDELSGGYDNAFSSSGILDHNIGETVLKKK